MNEKLITKVNKETNTLDINVNVRYQQEGYTESELNLIKNIFGIFSENVYFSMSCQESIPMDYDFITFTGISGSGKTVIKDEMKKDLRADPELNVIDFDDTEYFLEKYGEMNILDLFKITDQHDPVLKVLSGFGLFEIRILLTPIKTLSNGQRKRLRYVYITNMVKDDKKNIILIDEFGSELDTLSTISFTRALVSYTKSKNAMLFVFGVQDAVVGQVNCDIKGIKERSFIMGNATVNTVVDNGQVIYKQHLTPRD